MSHSKRNTSRSFFSSHERNQLKSHWGSTSTRLSRDSFLPFGSCQLCLLSVRDPVACASGGHLFCRECALGNLVAQGKEIKRVEREIERERQEVERERVEGVEREGERKRVEFERVQAGLGVGGKRKEREGEEEEGFGLAKVGREGVFKRRIVEGEGKEEGKGSAFWIPAEVPGHKKEGKVVRKLHPVCPAAAGDSPHEFSLKGLVAVKFQEETKEGEKEGETPNRTCPSCNKVLTNSSKAVLAKPCGHVLCQSCSDKFQKVGERAVHDGEGEDEGKVRCYVCGEDVTPGKKREKGKKDKDGKEKKGKERERGLVQICCDGTGFAGGGKNMVKKEGVAFQC